MVLFRQLTAKFAPFGARVSNRALSLQRVHPRGGPQPLNFHAHTRALFTRQKNVCEYCDKPRKPNCRYAYSQQLQGTLDPPEHQAPPETQAPGAAEGGLRLESVEEVGSERMLQLKWAEGGATRFPYLFLRDSCQCERCFHPFTKARLILMQDLRMESYPTGVQIDNEAGELRVTWDDGHVSPFTFTWLRDHSFTEEAARRQDALLGRRPTPWGREMQDAWPTADFNELLQDDHALLRYLTDMEEFGFVLIKKAGRRPGEVERFSDRVSFHRTTHYGPTFDVKASPTPSNLAYTSGTLGLHTDIPYDRHPPGVQFLHCIKQTTCSGGENQFSDAFYAAQILEKEFPEYFSLLCTVPINFVDVGTDHYGEFHKLSRHPIFTRDIEGNVVAIQCANQTRDSFMKQQLPLVEPTIRALRKLDDVLYENHIRFKLEEGDIVSFGNRRVLHGRASYSVAAGTENQRHLQGTYIDLDEINSRRRLLKQKLNLGVFSH